MARCWEQRDCDGTLLETCPHPNELKDRCPTKCAFSRCDRPQHVLTTDPELVFSPSVDREAAIKEECIMCGFFLEHGPRIDDSEDG